MYKFVCHFISAAKILIFSCPDKCFNLFLFSSSIFVIHYSQANKGNFPFCPSKCLLQYEDKIQKNISTNSELPYNKKNAPQSICNYFGCALFRFCKSKKTAK